MSGAEGARGIAAVVTSRIQPLVEAFRALQAVDGSVPLQQQAAGALLEQIIVVTHEVYRMLDGSGFADVFERDARAWLARGLQTPPNFSDTRDAFMAPRPDELALFVGPTIAQNGPPPRGHFLEVLLVQCIEPDAARDLRRTYEHQGLPCQTTRLIAGSRGFGFGNCVVFFPEYVAATRPIDRQGFAIFLFNKFMRIYQLLTMRNVRALFGPADALFGGAQWLSMTLSPEEFYSLRCIWGVMHDYFHHVGPRPLHQHLLLKQDWSLSTLEELKVDCQTVLAAERDRFQGWQALAQFVLFERMFRYPAQDGAASNFDSATGWLLFEYLWVAGAMRSCRGKLRLAWDPCLDALQRFVKEVEAAESEPHDDAYREEARSLLSRYLPSASGSEQPYEAPKNYVHLVAPHVVAPVHSMHGLPY